MSFSLKKTAYLILGIFFLIVAIIGAFVPLLPTTPFALLSAFFFSHSNKKLYFWLLTLPVLGKLIKNWNQYRVITLRSKIEATFVIVAFIIWAIIHFWSKPVIWGINLVIISLVLTFIWSRKSKV